MIVMSSVALPMPAKPRTHKLSIAHVVLSLDVGGLERVVLHLAREGMAAGRDVSIICLEKPGAFASHASAAGMKLIILGKRPGLTPGLVTDIRAVLREIRPDVVHTHQIGALLYTGPAARREHIPVVLHTEHINHVARCGSRMRKARTLLLWWAAGRYAAKFCCVSQDIADTARLVVRPSKLCVVENGIPTSDGDSGDYRQQTRALLGIPSGAPVIGLVARLNEIKRQDLLLRAFVRVRARYPAAHLLLVGDGPTRSLLEELVSELGIASSVHFAGYQAEPHRYLQAMDVFVLPSRLEGMPLAILEAWAARLPVIASRVGGVPKLVTDGVTGLLFDSGDQPALEAALLRVFGDAELGRRLGLAGRNRVEADFDTRRMAAEYHRHYMEILESDKTAAAGRSRIEAI
jgi:glycosyltransferase involved in cell wall biosynthesis